ncbi:MAG: hypothetical protein EXR95_09260 [Gemmatimonadetes bacterium]|nr:hypothetical protein [Gemmatimonadota bacterium]
MRGCWRLAGTRRGCLALALLATGATALPDRAGAQSAAAAQGFDFRTYRERVEPIFLNRRTGHGLGLSPCVGCHVHSTTPFQLEPMQVDAAGRAFWSEEQSRRNLGRLARLLVPGRPDSSRLLRAALANDAGGTVYHSGGAYWKSKDDPEWRLLADWVRAASPPPDPAEAAPAPRPTLDFAFFRTCVQKVFLRKRPGLARCVNCHDQPPRNFAPPLRPDEAIWNEADSRRNLEVLMRFIEPGDPAASRFLHHPLAREAGGDPFHAGGRHWTSKDDSEWRMLEAWVRGETPSRCLIPDTAADAAS